MAKKKGQTKQTTAAAVDLEALSQQEAAWLIGKPTSWLRNRADLDGRRPDGKYDGARLVKAFVELQQTELAEHQLTDEEIHCIDAGCFVEVYGDGLPIRTIEKIRSRHGVLGMAAVGEQFLLSLRESDHSYPDDPPQTEAEIRAEVQVEAEKQVAKRLQKQEALQLRRQGKMIEVCPSCGRYRYAREWRPAPAPKGYLAEKEFECDRCRVDRFSGGNRWE